MSQNNHAFAFRPITHALIRRTLIWVSIATVVFCVLQAVVTYRLVNDETQGDVHNLVQTHVKLLSVAVWDLDPDAIQREVNLLLEGTPMAYAQVRSSDGSVYEVGRLKPGRWDRLENYPITRPGHPNEVIGSLKIRIDGRRMLANVLTNVAMVFLQGVVLTAIKLGLVVTILRRDLQKPMTQLANFVNGIRADNLGSRLDLQRPTKRRSDEIDLVVKGFRHLQARLRRHIATLDEQVARRTQQLNDALDTLKKMSTADALTGCFNRQHLNEAFPAEVQRAERYQHDLSVIFCDADHFKGINDTHGHLVGDAVLKALGGYLQESVRPDIDWVVRFGGEEFLIILPETSASDAVTVAERLRRQIEESLRLPLDGGGHLAFTVSMGVAQRLPGEKGDALIARADGALYAAKEAGRNKVWIAPVPAG